MGSILRLVHRDGCAIELWPCLFPGPSTFSLLDGSRYTWCRCTGLALPSALVTVAADFSPCKGGSPWLLQSLSRELLQPALLLQQIYRCTVTKEEGKHLETHLHWTMSHSCPRRAVSPVSRSAQCQCPALMAPPAWLPVPGSVSLCKRLVLVWLCLKALIAARSPPRASPSFIFLFAFGVAA